MPTAADVLRWHMRDRGLLPWTVARAASCGCVALVPWLVSIPSHQQLQSVAFFLPLLFGVLGAVTLRESTQWMRPTNRRLWGLRAASTFVSDVLCLLPLAAAALPPSEHQGLLAGALCVMSLAMIVCCVVQDCAWMGAAVAGLLCLLAFDRPLVFFIPLEAAVGSYVVALLSYAIVGPRGVAAP